MGLTPHRININPSYTDLASTVNCYCSITIKHGISKCKPSDEIMLYTLCSLVINKVLISTN